LPVAYQLNNRIDKAGARAELSTTSPSRSQDSRENGKINAIVEGEKI